jgi:alcohol dehydrogenase class IV
MQFQFRCAGQLLFGRGEHRRAAGLAAGLGRRVFLVTGAASLAKSGVLSSLTASLAERAEHIEHVTVSAEPTVDQADSLAKQCQAAGCQVVLAVGGGSVLDVGKAVAALATNAGAGIDYLEDVGRGPPRALAEVPLPVVAVPTTAGSGSEVTRNSVLKVPELQVKRSLRSDLMIPKVAIVDPDLLTTAPQRVAASAGMDALTHLIEGYLSTGAQPLTDALALRGIRLLWQALHRLADCFRGRLASLHPDTYEQLALTSLWGGIVLANAGLGAVHGLVAPLGGLVQCGPWRWLRVSVAGDVSGQCAGSSVETASQSGAGSAGGDRPAADRRQRRCGCGGRAARVAAQRAGDFGPGRSGGAAAAV